MGTDSSVLELDRTIERGRHSFNSIHGYRIFRSEKVSYHGTESHDTGCELVLGLV
jgi:hypothetical protein